MSDVELCRYVEKAMMDCIKWPKLNHYNSPLPRMQASAKHLIRREKSEKKCNDENELSLRV